MLGFWLQLARQVEKGCFDVVDQLLAAGLTTTIRLHMGKEAELARYKMDWAAVTKKLGELAPSVLLWSRWFHEATEGMNLGTDTRAALKALEAKKIRFEGRPITKDRLELCILADELGLFTGKTWAAAWAIEVEFGKGVTNFLNKLTVILRGARKMYSDCPVGEKADTLAHFNPKLVCQFLFEFLLVALRSEFATIDDFQSEKSVEVFIRIVYMKLSLVALASSVVGVCDLEDKVKDKLQRVVQLFAAPLEFYSMVDSSAFDPARDFCAKVFAAGGSDPQEDSVENFVSAVYQLFDGSDDEEIKECSDDMELSAFPRYVLEETGTQKELLKVWQNWYKGIQVRKGGLVQLGLIEFLCSCPHHAVSCWLVLSGRRRQASLRSVSCTGRTMTTPRAPRKRRILSGRTCRRRGRPWSRSWW